MIINIFLLCYNEEIILPHTINHYKTNLPSCKITIYDNESTDNSVEIAKTLGCNVISWSSGNIIDDRLYLKIKNNCWKDIEEGWIIMADMDEWLCINEEQLNAEEKLGTTIIRTRGIGIVGESKCPKLSDIKLNELNKFDYANNMNKLVCFLRPSVNQMNYGWGAHKCNPEGIIKYSNHVYYMKHMVHLGLSFLIQKWISRYNRSNLMRSMGLCTHYITDISTITNEYSNKVFNAKHIFTDNIAI
jgi:hypothetical protein